MTKLKTVSLISIIMSLAFFMALLWGYSQYQQSRQALQLLENEYQRAYYNYLADLGKLDNSLAQIQGTSAHQQAISLSQIGATAASAVDNLSLLPLQQYSYQRSNAYLNQISDYSLSLASQLAKGGQMPTDALSQIQQIEADLMALNDEMAEMETAVNGGDIIFSEGLIEDNWWQIIRLSLGGTQAAQGEQAALDEISADGYFARANALLEGSELLAYGGQHSSHMDNLPVKGLANARNINQEQALSLAEQFLSNLGQEKSSLIAQSDIGAESNLPLFSFQFAADAEQKSHIYLTISQAGGQIISYFAEPSNQEQAEQIEIEQAIKEAEAILKGLGYEHLKLTSRQTIGEELHLIYNHFEDEILYYPDSLNLKISTATGQIKALNSNAYWTNHSTRVLPETMPELAQSQAVLGENADISSSGLAYIDNGAGGEILCHEFQHNIGDNSFISHIGLKSGAEEQVLSHFKGDDGSFYSY